VRRNQAPARRAIHRISMILTLLLVVSGLGNSVFAVSAFAAQAGQKCTKVGSKSGSLVCTKVQGKLIWQLAKKAQTLSVQFPIKASVTSKTILIKYSSSSKLPVKAVSISSAICTINITIVSLKNPGYCVIRLSQSGNSQFLSAITKEIKILILGTNQISFNLPNSLPLSANTYPLLGTSTSGLPLEYASLAPDICSVSGSILGLTKPGLCTVRASQSGSSIYEPAQPIDASITIQSANQISFSVPSSLLLSSKTYSLAGTSTSGLPLTYESLTADICSVSAAIVTLTKLGVCTIRASQNGSSLYGPANYVDASITISEVRVTSDQPDAVTGFQVHPIYVVPSDGVDHSYDTNGFIAGILDEGNSYVLSQIGYNLPIDRTATGYDIQYLKSNLSTADFQTTKNLTEKMLTESLALENPGTNRKDYIFFIDVTNLAAGQACGIGATPGMSAVVAIGTGVECTGNSFNFNNYAASTWPHELIHNFGVKHTLDDPCDFMRGAETPGTCPPSSTLTMDKERTRYVGSSAQGQDIMKLRVWAGHTDNLNLQADCSLDPVSRADGVNFAYCPTGTQIIGALKNCWNPINFVTLEELVNGQWISLGSGGSDPNPWGPDVSWTCGAGFSAPWKQLTVTTPGISLYRWMINGLESEQFKVIWVL